MRHIVSQLAVICTALIMSTAIQQEVTSQANQAMKVDLDELEDHPERFLGKTVTVEGEVDRVLGPNLFTIDEKDWADLEREMPVVVPDPFTAIVHRDAPVRVTGTVEQVPVARIEQRGGALTDRKIRAEIETEPALVAKEVSALSPAAVEVNLLVNPGASQGTGGKAPVTDANQVAKSSDKSLIGRRVNLTNSKVTGTEERGFWITTSGGERIFVMPGSKTSVKSGQAADIQGVILELPEGLRVELKAKGEPIYIYADRVTAR